MQNPLKSNPVVLIVGTAVVVTNATLALLYGWPIVHWTEAQLGLVMAVVNPITALASALVSQQFTTPYDPEIDNTAVNTLLYQAKVDELTPAPRKRAAEPS